MKSSAGGGGVSRFGFSRPKLHGAQDNVFASKQTRQPTATTSTAKLQNDKSPTNLDNSQASRFGFSRQRSNVNNNKVIDSKNNMLRREVSAKIDNQNVPIPSLTKSPNLNKKLSPKLAKKSSPKTGRHISKPGSPARVKKEVHRGGLVPRPYKPISEKLTQPLLSLTETGALVSHEVQEAQVTAVSGKTVARSGRDVQTSVPTSTSSSALTKSDYLTARQPTIALGGQLSRSAPTSADSRPATVGVSYNNNNSRLVAGLTGSTSRPGGLAGSRTFTSLPRPDPVQSIDANENKAKTGYSKTDLPGLRASFFGKSVSSSKLPSGSSVSRGGSSMDQILSDTNTLYKTSENNINQDKPREYDSVDSSDGSRLNSANIHSRFNQQLRRSPVTTQEELAFIGGLSSTSHGSDDSRQKRSFVAKIAAAGQPVLPPSSQSVNQQDCCAETLEKISALSNLNQISVGNRSWTRSRAEVSEAEAAVLSTAALSTAALPSAGPGKRKWTRKLKTTTSIDRDQIVKAGTDEPVTSRPSALECLNQLKSSTRTVLEQHRTGIRTNPKVSLRRPVLPAIPQEGSFYEDHLTRPESDNQVTPAVTTDPIVSAASSERVAAVDLDLDDELVVLDVDDSVVDKSVDSVVRFDTDSAHSERQDRPVKPGGGESRTDVETSPNETESDSGIFTSSHSRYSLESLQEDNTKEAKVTKEKKNEDDDNAESDGGANDGRRGASQPPPSTQYYQASVKLSHSLPSSFLRMKDKPSRYKDVVSVAEDRNKTMASSTNTFSDIDDMCSSRETSPLELLDELFKKADEKKDERKSISPGLVKEHRQIFERRSQEFLDAPTQKSASMGNKNTSDKSSIEKLKEILQNEKASFKQIISPSSSDGDTSSLTSVTKPSVKQSNQEFTGSITNSISMSSSFTESQSTTGDPLVTEKTRSTTKTTPSPSSFSDDKDFLIDDDYKDQPQLTFYEQDDSIEESLFSTLDSLLAGKDTKEGEEKETSVEKKEENSIKEEVESYDVAKKAPPVALTGSPLRAISAGSNLRKFSLTNHMKEQLDRTNEDSERSRLRSRADTLSSLASDDCILDYDCGLSEEEEEGKIFEKERSMSPRIREASKQFEEKKAAEEKQSAGSSVEVPCRGDTDPFLDYRPSLSRSSSITSDEGVIIDRSTHNTITQDTLEIKFLLLKLRRILQETDAGEGSISNRLLENVLSNDTDNSLREENVDLKRQVVLLQQQIEEKDRRLRQLEMLHKTGSFSKANTTLKNTAMQTDRQRPMSCGSLSQDGLIRFDD